MAQHDYDIANGPGVAVRTDINNALGAVVSLNSGNSAPSPTFSYQQWADTSTGLLKIRNGSNDAWVTVGTLDAANLGLATLASPTLTGNPKSVTPAAGDNNTNIATTAFVKALVDSAVSTAVDAATKSQADINGFAYPVGSIYTSILETNPATLLAMGTWVAFGAGRVLAGRDGGDTSMQTAEQTGGAKTHTLTINEIPSHVHGYTGTAGNGDPDGGGDRGGQMYPRASELDYEGGGAQHNIMQPYIVVYFWKRTA